MPAGSGDVVFTPWLAGERSPVDDRKARGGFHNLSLATTRAHLVRAVLEGVAYNSRWLHEAVERFVRRRLDPVRVIGGGATSDLWCQIHADVMGRTMERVAEPLRANLRGAAMFAGLGPGRDRPRGGRTGSSPSTAASSPNRLRPAPTTGCSASSPTSTGRRSRCSPASTGATVDRDVGATILS